MDLPIEIFFCYAHEDEAYLDKLKAQLKLLERQGFITMWHDRDINAGKEWRREIDVHLKVAQIILLLISPNFMDSDYCYDIEMKLAMERHEGRDTHVIPIILHPVHWQGSPFGKLQVLPDNGKPVTHSSWPSLTDALFNVAEGIRTVIEDVRRESKGKSVNVPLPIDATNISNIENASTNHMLERMATEDLPYNAFHFSEPLPSAEELYGRVRERKTLLNRTYRGASTSIVGPRRVGKTWLISYLDLMASHELGARFKVGYLDASLASCATVNEFASRALEVLDLSGYVLRSANVELKVLEGAIENLKSRSQVPVLCIDEFEAFCNRQVFDLHFFSALRAMTQTGLCLIIASKNPLIDIVGNSGKTSGFFNVFEQITIKPFTMKEAEQFAVAKGTQANFTHSERTRLLHYGQVEGKHWPIRLQLVGKMLLEDKLLSAQENDPDYYRPDDSTYWQEFEERLTEIYQGVVS